MTQKMVLLPYEKYNRFVTMNESTLRREESTQAEIEETPRRRKWTKL